MIRLARVECSDDTFKYVDAVVRGSWAACPIQSNEPDLERWSLHLVVDEDRTYVILGWGINASFYSIDEDGYLDVEEACALVRLLDERDFVPVMLEGEGFAGDDGYVFEALAGEALAGLYDTRSQP